MSLKRKVKRNLKHKTQLLEAKQRRSEHFNHVENKRIRVKHNNKGEIKLKPLKINYLGIKTYD